MARKNPISKSIYRRHIKLYRYLNDTWIFCNLIRPELEKRALEFAASASKAKKRYPVPKKNKTIYSRRKDSDISKIYRSQYERGIFETNIVSIVSRVEAYIQECLIIVIRTYPKKLSIISGNDGIPIDLFLDHEDREELLERYISLKCEELMFENPEKYISKIEKTLSIYIGNNLAMDYIEIKASRDIIVHNLGEVNDIYLRKSGKNSRGTLGNKLEINQRYFKHVITASKNLSGTIQREAEKIYR